MARWIPLAGALAALASPVWGQEVSPCAGEEARAIKALSEEEVRALLAGEGMGLAKAAELNHYPGPRHVLDMADSLELSAEQRAGVEEIRARMSGRARTLGAEIVQAESALDNAFAGGAIDAAGVREATREIARLQGELRATHLLAHVETRAVLTPHQVVTYDRLRGYGTGDHGGHAH